MLHSFQEDDSDILSKHKPTDVLPTCQKENVPASTCNETVSHPQNQLSSKFNFLKPKQTSCQMGNQSTDKLLSLYNDQSMENQSVGQKDSVANQHCPQNVLTKTGIYADRQREGLGISNTNEINESVSRNPLFSSGGESSLLFYVVLLFD